MDNSAINVRYAKAFFLLAKEKNLLRPLKSDVELLVSVCKTSTEFNLLLESPLIKTSKKTELFNTIFSGRVNPYTINFLKLIAENKREVHIPGICRDFLSLFREDQNVKTAVLTTASELNDSTIRKIEKLISSQLDSEIELDIKVNPKILGGLILRVDDKQYDASLARQLRKIKHIILETELEK